MQDVVKVRHFINKGPKDERVRKEERLQAMLRYARTAGCRRVPLLNYFSEAISTKQCTMCDNCLSSGGITGSKRIGGQARRSRTAGPGVDERILLPTLPVQADSPHVDDSGAERLLFEELRKVRSALAKEASVPPFVIFSDRTLAEMVSRRPHSPEALLTVTGVGEHKLAHYGEQFLDVIRSFCMQHDLRERPVSTKKKRNPKPSPGSLSKTPMGD